jgi:hypothetical protein
MDEEIKRLEAWRGYEDCPELNNNEVLKKAAEIHLEYACKLGELFKGYSYSQCRELFHVCDLAKGNNCEAEMYRAIPDVKDHLNDVIAWHCFNRNVHGIDLT